MTFWLAHRDSYWQRWAVWEKLKMRELTRKMSLKWRVIRTPSLGITLALMGSKAQTTLPHRGLGHRSSPSHCFIWFWFWFILQHFFYLISQFIKEKSSSYWWIILHKALTLPRDVETVMRSASCVYRWWLITFNCCQLRHNVEFGLMNKRYSNFLSATNLITSATGLILSLMYINVYLLYNSIQKIEKRVCVRVDCRLWYMWVFQALKGLFSHPPPTQK